jgi:hypothetical protein
MHGAWHKAVALDGGSDRRDVYHFRHALVRGYTSIASELCDWSNYDDAAIVIGWAAALQHSPGGAEVFANATVKSIIAQGAVDARSMDLGLKLWKEIVGPLPVVGGGEDKELEIRGRCLLLHKLQFAAECARPPLPLPLPPSPTAPSGTTTQTTCGTASCPACSYWRTVRRVLWPKNGHVT